MKNIPFIQYIKNLFKKTHIHSFTKPIISRYISIYTRDIIYECKCGKRELKEYSINSTDEPFPIQTTPFLEKSDMDRILNNDIGNKQQSVPIY